MNGNEILQSGLLIDGGFEMSYIEKSLEELDQGGRSSAIGSNWTDAFA
jgi:hypothetical protein